MRKCKHNWHTEQRLVFGPIQIEKVNIDESLCSEMLFENQNTMHIEEEILENWKVWNKFKKLFPNSPEVYPHYSRENIARWNYHIAHAEIGEKFEPVAVNKALLEQIRLERAVSVFERFPSETAKRYEEITWRFPGVHVYACGSRVRGDWWDMEMDRMDISNDIILQARYEGGMRIDKYSDYDFWVEPNAVAKEPLPIWADRFRGKFNEKEMVAIPIYNGI